MGKLKRLLCFYFDLPTVLVIVLLTSIFYRPIANLLFMGSKRITILGPVPEWVNTLGLNILGGVLALVIVAIIGFVLFNIKYKSEIAGEYKAYDLTKDKKEDWGNVTIKYNLITNQFRTYQRGDVGSKTT